MDWAHYKRICDSPDVCSRWLLEQSRELVDDHDLKDRLTRALMEPPIVKPRDHRGGAGTDMFRPRLELSEAERLRHAVEQAIVTGRTTAATATRGLGGFAEAWLEYENALRHGTGRDDMAATPGRNDGETQVLGLIDAFNRIDLERIIGCFAEDAVYHNIPMEPVTGPAAIRQVLQSFMGSAEQVQWDLLHIASTDAGAVLTERVDKFKINGHWIELPVMGTFEVRGGKIAAWRDYFDLAQFQQEFAKTTGG